MASIYVTCYPIAQKYVYRLNMNSKVCDTMWMYEGGPEVLWCLEVYCRRRGREIISDAGAAGKGAKAWQTGNGVGSSFFFFFPQVGGT